MLKHVDVSKSTARLKSTRLPLRNISNSKNGARDFSRSTKAKKKLPAKKEQQVAAVGDNGLDRLLLVHSDLSSIVEQIDELVVQALTSKKEIKEIKSFADFLSEMQASLKLWVPRFQKALSDPSSHENMAEQPPPASNKVTVVKEDSPGEQPPPASNKVTVVKEDSPGQYKWDSLVCSSPLVSWRGDCTSECDRQLFLLTPLHQHKGLSSKFMESSKSIFEEIRSDQVSQFPLHHHLEESKIVSPGKVSSQESSFMLMTPCLKVSPPKSCVVLEPVSEYRYKGNLKFHISTPYPCAVQNPPRGSQDSESSSGQSSDYLNLKYPELFGINLLGNHQLENRWKLAEESPKWSPPKTCVLLEPPEDGIPETVLNPTQELGSKYGLVESTPMMKEAESCMKTGKRPGENTLKRELWTKFEAASTHEMHFDPPPTMQKMTLHKGFLDRLDEVSSDE